MIAAILDFKEGAGMFGEGARHMRRGFAYRHDVGYQGLLRRMGRVVGGVHLVAVADHRIDLGHFREGFRLRPRGAAGHHDLRIGSVPVGAADGLAGLANRLGRHRATVHDDQVILSVGHFATDNLSNRLALRDVEATAQRDDLRPAHLRSVPSRPRRRRHGWQVRSS